VLGYRASLAPVERVHCVVEAGRPYSGMAGHSRKVPRRLRPVESSRHSGAWKIASMVSVVVIASLCSVGVMLVPELFTSSTMHRTVALASLKGVQQYLGADDVPVLPPRAGKEHLGDGHGSTVVRHNQHALRSSLAASVFPPFYARLGRVPPRKYYENVRYHKVPSGEVAYYGDDRFGPWFVEHTHANENGKGDADENAESEVNSYRSDCTGGCDLRESRMLEAAEAMVRTAMDTQTSREEAYHEQKLRTTQWAHRIAGMLDSIAPKPADMTGRCHRTVDCEYCEEIHDEDLCKRKMGMWVPYLSVQKAAEEQARASMDKVDQSMAKAAEQVTLAAV